MGRWEWECKLKIALKDKRFVTVNYSEWHRCAELREYHLAQYIVNEQWKYLDFSRKNNVFYTVFKVRSGLTEIATTSEKYSSIPSYNNINLVYHTQKEYVSENWQVILGVHPAEIFLLQRLVLALRIICLLSVSSAAWNLCSLFPLLAAWTNTGSGEWVCGQLTDWSTQLFFLENIASSPDVYISDARTRCFGIPIVL